MMTWSNGRQLDEVEVGVRKEQHYESIIPLMDQISLYSMIFLLIPITRGGKTYEKKDGIFDCNY